MDVGWVRPGVWLGWVELGQARTTSNTSTPPAFTISTAYFSEAFTLFLFAILGATVAAHCIVCLKLACVKTNEMYISVIITTRVGWVGLGRLTTRSGWL